jgi:hypothetical protein
MHGGSQFDGQFDDDACVTCEISQCMTPSAMRLDDVEAGRDLCAHRRASVDSFLVPDTRERPLMVSAKPRGRFTRFLRAFIIVPLVLGVIVVAGFRFVSLRRESGERTQLAPNTGRFVKAGDLEIFIQEAGPVDGPPVLMVHGTGAWSAIWRETMDALAAKGYRAIAIDVPPFGYSERPLTPQYGDGPQAARIVGVLDASIHRACVSSCSSTPR